MRKPKRRKLILEDLEEKLEKYSRRIQRISEEAYRLRQLIEHLQSIPANVPLTKKAREEAAKGETLVTSPNEAGITAIEKEAEEHASH